LQVSPEICANQELGGLFYPGLCPLSADEQKLKLDLKIDRVLHDPEYCYRFRIDKVLHDPEYRYRFRIDRVLYDREYRFRVKRRISRLILGQGNSAA